MKSSGRHTAGGLGRTDLWRDKVDVELVSSLALLLTLAVEDLILLLLISKNLCFFFSCGLNISLET